MTHQQAEQAVMYWFGVFLDATCAEERAFAGFLYDYCYTQWERTNV